MELFIRTTRGKTITLEVGGSDTFDFVIANIKDIAHECSFDNCSCFPSIIAKMELLIRSTTGKGKAINLEVGGSDTFDLVKAKIKDICSSLDDNCDKDICSSLDDNCDIRWELIPKSAEWWPRSMPIFVRILNEKTITLAVKPGDTISHLMDMITYKEGIFRHRQNLFLAGMRLEKNRTLDHYNIDAGSTLDLVLQGGQREIYVETTAGEKIPLKVVEDVMIKEVKELIEKEAGIPLEQQRLVYAGEELEDARFLRTCYIHEKAILRLVDDALMKRREWIRIHIQISATQMTIHLNVETTDTIHTLKSKIEAQEHILAPQQLLFLPHKRLHEDAFTLADYFIQNESTLYLAQILGENKVVST